MDLFLAVSHIQVKSSSPYLGALFKNMGFLPYTIIDCIVINSREDEQKNREREIRGTQEGIVIREILVSLPVMKRRLY